MNDNLCRLKNMWDIGSNDKAAVAWAVEAIEKLAAELKLQRTGWVNAMEVGLIAGEYEEDGKKLVEGASVALAFVGEI